MLTDLRLSVHAGKDSAPARTIATRAKDPKAFQTPAPGTYEPKDDDDSPRYSFGLRPNLEKPNNVPGVSLVISDCTQENVTKPDGLIFLSAFFSEHCYAGAIKDE